jgi:hypothetical protein
MKREEMRQAYRWIIAIPLALVSLGVIAAVYPMGFFLGGMATDSCSGLAGWSTSWLSIFWPKAMVTSALIPPLLILAQVRWRWVLLGLAIGPVVSVGCYLLWFPILSLTCK